MTVARSHLTAIVDADLFEYPIGRHERLDTHSFIKWQFHRWLGSKMSLMASYEVQGMARQLFDLSQTQSPPGTLPIERPVIARMLRVEVNHFESLCRHDYGPLQNWQPCRADDGELRLFHQVVLDQVQDALDRRERRDLTKTDRAQKMRKRRMVEAMAAAGVDASILADPVFVDRCDQWLSDHWKSNRSPDAYERVLSHAAKERWFAPHRGN
ncbi:MAG: hypothetical protein V4659_03940 [Pseudomonadota bacterium]